MKFKKVGKSMAMPKMAMPMPKAAPAPKAPKATPLQHPQSHAAFIKLGQ